MLNTQLYFDEIYANKDDPWGYEQRWYEQRKRHICLSVLLKPHYQQALEIGCSNGVFSEALAARCDQLLCLDGHFKAVDLARQRLAAYSHVEVQQAWVPTQLPHQSFDLIIVSEILYYLDTVALDEVMTWLNKHLIPGGTLLCCHWRHSIEGFELDGNLVHQHLQQLNLDHYLTVKDPDFLIDVWSNASINLAQQEGLV
ncbi:SAM-dependent methyltransferase [uncultured Acinetobacter sp.]|uniref:class I SAM-dependent DNA methyltransferase n=1 Tax=uncultured Acinetobacter sp. TaxID=165433 RepID=UPI002626C050|nr:SAM-dependent methyltransferase [uncultured Acinetobacter sp.]